jgi:hypothetical protein
MIFLGYLPVLYHLKGLYKGHMKGVAFPGRELHRVSGIRGEARILTTLADIVPPGKEKT